MEDPIRMYCDDMREMEWLRMEQEKELLQQALDESLRDMDTDDLDSSRHSRASSQFTAEKDRALSMLERCDAEDTSTSLDFLEAEQEKEMFEMAVRLSLSENDGSNHHQGSTCDRLRSLAATLGEDFSESEAEDADWVCSQQDDEVFGCGGIRTQRLIGATQPSMRTRRLLEEENEKEMLQLALDRSLEDEQKQRVVNIPDTDLKTHSLDTPRRDSLPIIRERAQEQSEPPIVTAPAPYHKGRSSALSHRLMEEEEEMLQLALRRSVSDGPPAPRHRGPRNAPPLVASLTREMPTRPNDPPVAPAEPPAMSFRRQAPALRRTPTAPTPYAAALVAPPTSRARRRHSTGMPRLQPSAPRPEAPAARAPPQGKEDDFHVMEIVRERAQRAAQEVAAEEAAVEITWTPPTTNEIAWVPPPSFLPAPLPSPPTSLLPLLSPTPEAEETGNSNKEDDFHVMQIVQERAQRAAQEVGHHERRHCAPTGGACWQQGRTLSVIQANDGQGIVSVDHLETERIRAALSLGTITATHTKYLVDLFSSSALVSRSVSDHHSESSNCSQHFGSRRLV